MLSGGNLLICSNDASLGISGPSWCTTCSVLQKPPLSTFLEARREVKAQPLNDRQHTELKLDDADVISAFVIHDVDSYDSD